MSDNKQSYHEAQRLEREVRRICYEFGLAELYVFGSRANEIAALVRGEAIETAEHLSRSDVDTGVRPLPGLLLDVDSLVSLADELERCLTGCGKTGDHECHSPLN